MTPLDWHYNDGYAVDHFGSRSLLIDGNLSISAAAQLETLGYPLASPNSGWDLTEDNFLIKTGAPPLPPCAYAVHLGERIYAYPFGYIVVLALNNSYKLFYTGE